MTIGSPRRFFSNSRGRVIGRREASAGGWMFGCALIGESASRLSIGIEDGVVDETGGADAGRHGDEDLAVDARDRRQVVGARRARGSRARRRARASRPARRRAARRRRARRRSATPRRPPGRRAARARARGRRRAGARCGSTAPARRPRAPSGTPRSRTGRSRSRTRRRMTSACWASFWPKKATSGPTMFSSLVTTVATPSKWPTPRYSPSSVSVTPPTCTVVAKPGG